MAVGKALECNVTLQPVGPDWENGKKALGKGELGSERLESGHFIPAASASYRQVTLSQDPLCDPLFAPSVKWRVTIVSALPSMLTFKWYLFLFVFFLT